MTSVMDGPRRVLRSVTRGQAPAHRQTEQAPEQLPRMRREPVEQSPGAAVATWLLGGLAAVAIWLVAFGLIFSALAEQHAQHGLYNDFREKLAGGVAPLNDAVSPGTPVALLDSSRAQLHGVVVVQGTSGGELRNGPGHQPGTPLPGQPGVPLIMGRSASYGAPFAHIADLRKNDRITATTGQGRFTYVVVDVRRPGDPFPPVLATGGSQLTLVTSEGTGWQAGWAPSHAVFVDAVLHGSAYFPAPGNGIPGPSDGVLKHDTSGLYPLVLWMQLLAVAVVGGVWSRRRWGQWQSWLVVGPVAAAALWGATTEAWLLLPNLL